MLPKRIQLAYLCVLSPLWSRVRVQLGLSNGLHRFLDAGDKKEERRGGTPTLLTSFFFQTCSGSSPGGTDLWAKSLL